MSYRLHKQSLSPPSRGRYWWLAGIAAIYSGLIYLNALHNPYVYDDNRTVLNNTSIEDITNVRHIVFREMTRPVVNFTYALDRAIWPSQPFGHHTTSVLLHVVNVLLVFRLAWLATLDRRAHGPPGPVERGHANDCGIRDRLAFRPASDADRVRWLYQRSIGARVLPVLPARPPGGAAVDSRRWPALVGRCDWPLGRRR